MKITIIVTNEGTESRYPYIPLLKRKLRLLKLEKSENDVCSFKKIPLKLN